MNQRIEIVPYQERWAEEFLEIAGRLRAGLGGLAVRIDHIGSTSVPGLAAKDIIDIQITVSDLSEEVIQTMAGLGYTRHPIIHRDHPIPGFQGPDTEWEKFLFEPLAGQRKTNTHMRALGRANQRYALLFRDYLRSHSPTAQAYAELKRRLAASLPDRKLYPEVKDPAVDLIYFAAEEWAAVNGWQPGPSDA